MLQIIEDTGAEVVVVGSEFFGHIEAIEDRLTKVRSIVQHSGGHHGGGHT
jgi:long-chain acyl-CoA synthetase